MRNRISIGIDTGLSGAIAAINAGSLEIMEVMDTPVITSEGKRLYDVGGMADAIRHLSLLGDAVVILEQAQAMPGQGVSSTFSTGRGFGIWEGVKSIGRCAGRG
jgi:crossover junction endodeoxyribonuclease RuvC